MGLGPVNTVGTGRDARMTTSITTNNSLVGNALQLLAVGLGPYVSSKVREAAGMGRYVPDDLDRVGDIEGDVSLILRVMAAGWNEIFRDHLGPAERSLVSEIRETRNRWAHQESFDDDDLDRALDSVGRLLLAVSANSEAHRVNKVKHELRRRRYAPERTAAPSKSVVPSHASVDHSPIPVPMNSNENSEPQEAVAPDVHPIGNHNNDSHREEPAANTETLVSETAKRVEYLIARGMEQRQQGEFDRAIADFEEAIELDRENPEAWYNRGLTWGHMGEYKRAINDINRALSINREYADAYNARGYARFCLGDLARASHDFEDALSLDPDDELARVNLEMVRKRLEERSSR